MQVEVLQRPRAQRGWDRARQRILRELELAKAAERAERSGKRTGESIGLQKDVLKAQSMREARRQCARKPAVGQLGLLQPTQPEDIGWECAADPRAEGVQLTETVEDTQLRRKLRRRREQMGRTAWQRAG